MTLDYVQLFEKDSSALVASVIALGLESSYFERATGLSFGVRLYKYESGAHQVSREDHDRLQALLAQTAEAEPEVWSDFSERAASSGRDLIDTAQSLAKLASGEHSERRDLADGFNAFAEAAKGAAPFVAAAPVVEARLQALIARTITEGAKGANIEPNLEEVLARIRLPPEGSEPLREIRSCYRIALEIAKNQPALELVQDKLPGTALGWIESEFPSLHDLIRHHVDEYGWIRARGGTLDPLSARDLIERIQKILLRWKPDTLQQAAEARPWPSPEEILGFSPSDALAGLIGTLQDLHARRWFRIDIYLQAQSIARPFLARVAEALGGTVTQLLYCSSSEIAEALTHQAELPLPEIDRRSRDGFVVERSRGTLRVSTGDSPAGEHGGAEPATLTGQSVSLGRAVGPVRIIFEPMEVLKLEIGEVLVTAASTPDKMGTESAFPARMDAPLGLENAAAIVTDEGGLLSHAAIISRELGIPCVVGTERATKVLIDGQVVEVDATKGAGKVIALDSA